MPKPVLEKWLEEGLFASRWLMAPFYIGLVLSLLLLMLSFGQELVYKAPEVITDYKRPEIAIVLALSLIDLSLAANLVLIVIFSGYENFVSKFDVDQSDDKPAWMGTVDFSGLKQKLIASIVAISGVSLLKAFLEVAEVHGPIDEQRLRWLVIVHLTFVLSGVLLALMDFLTSKAKKH